MGTPTLNLYLDDSGTRYPDHEIAPRKDGMDHFALGGLLLESEKVGEAVEVHRGFSAEYNLLYSLHSSSIRCAKKEFLWLKKDPERTVQFLSDLEKLLCNLPGHAIACVIHRPGYNARYADLYGDQRWRLCKTAYAIVVERAAKLTLRSRRRLRVHVEATGLHEDRMIKSYHSDLRTKGMYFETEASTKYSPLRANQLTSVLLKEPKFVPKSHEISQLSDLVLYPIIKGRYEPAYRPYRSLRTAKRLIDDVLSADEIPSLGIKYSCFDGL